MPSRLQVCRVDSKRIWKSKFSSEIKDGRNIRCRVVNLIFSQKQEKRGPSDLKTNAVQLRLFSELYHVKYGTKKITNPKIIWEEEDIGKNITQSSDRATDPVDWALMLVSQMQSIWKQQRIAYWSLEDFFGSPISHICPQISLESRLKLSACAWRLQRVERKPRKGHSYAKEQIREHQYGPPDENLLLQKDQKNKDLHFKHISGPVVVTGSNGGIGRLVLLWISQCSTKVLHFSRSKHASDHPFTANGNENLSITYKMLDASATEDVESSLHCEPKNPILLHCAGVLIDQALPFLQVAAFRKVNAPKYRGTLLLYLNMEKLASRCSILFGSAASVLGNPGQASYMMANTLMETIYKDKFRGGIPSHIIHWGPWDIEGMVDRKARRKLLVQGASLISPILGLKVLDNILEGMYDSVDGYICVLAQNGDNLEFFSDIKLELTDHRSSLSIEPEWTKDALLSYVRETASAVSGGDVSSSSLFLNEGIDSLIAVEFSNILGAKLGVDLPSTLLYDFPTPEDVVSHLQERHDDEEKIGQTCFGPIRTKMDDNEQLHIYIRNAAYNFPNPRLLPYEHLERDWVAGRDLQGLVPLSRWEMDGTYDPQARIGCSYTRFGTWIEHPDIFDRDLFAILPQESVTLDPQARILLELTFECKTQDGSRNVANFVGLMYNEYLDLILGPRQIADTMPTAITGTGMSFLVGRISYHHGLKGPSAAVDTACSSSLVALHLSCQALLMDQCKASLAQGINLMLSPQTTARICLLKALSSDGRCKTLDVGADGYGRGEGGCSMYIDRENRGGIQSNRNPMAIIHGSEIGHNGTSGGLVAPNGSSQRDLLASVSHRTGIFSSYISLHGTGTSLGDPIELGAIMDLQIPEGKKTNDPVYFASSKVNICALISI
jgi:acyl carrier protein